jgi:hypothetical protein
LGLDFEREQGPAPARGAHPAREIGA